MTPPDTVILCGGAAERLGGIDKPLALLAGRPLIERVIERVAPNGGRLIISANRHHEDYARYGVDVIDDGAHRGCGPLGGIAAGLAAATSPRVLFVPGDAPLLPDDLLSRLDDARIRASSTVTHADDGHGPQPLCCLIERAGLADLLAFLAAGGTSPRDWYARAGVTVARFGEWPRWAWSANTAEEWQDAELRLADTVTMSE